MWREVNEYYTFGVRNEVVTSIHMCAPKWNNSKSPGSYLGNSCLPISMQNCPLLVGRPIRWDRIAFKRLRTDYYI